MAYIVMKKYREVLMKFVFKKSLIYTIVIVLRLIKKGM